jgi:Sensors of blue-light using FAD
MLRRLAWSSVPSPSFSAARLNEIVAPSRRNNERNHLSGMLLFTGVHFLGVLEGDERDLGKLWLRLERDERHCDLIRIGDALCGVRWFPEWMMACTDHPDVGSQIENLRSPQARIASNWAEVIHPIMLRADGRWAGHVLAPTLVAAHT